MEDDEELRNAAASSSSRKEDMSNNVAKRRTEEHDDEDSEHDQVGGDTNDEGVNHRERRLKMNRESARKRRRRQGSLIRELQENTMRFAIENENLRKENKELQAQVEQLQAVLNSLTTPTADPPAMPPSGLPQANMVGSMPSSNESAQRQLQLQQVQMLSLLQSLQHPFGTQVAPELQQIISNAGMELPRVPSFAGHTPTGLPPNAVLGAPQARSGQQQPPSNQLQGNPLALFQAIQMMGMGFQAPDAQNQLATANSVPSSGQTTSEGNPDDAQEDPRNKKTL